MSNQLLAAVSWAFPLRGQICSVLLNHIRKYDSTRTDYLFNFHFGPYRPQRRLCLLILQILISKWKHEPMDTTQSSMRILWFISFILLPGGLCEPFQESARWCGSEVTMEALVMKVTHPLAGAGTFARSRLTLQTAFTAGPSGVNMIPTCCLCCQVCWAMQADLAPSCPQ